jgi:hypothetical protein
MRLPTVSVNAGAANWRFRRLTPLAVTAASNGGDVVFLK